MHRTTSRFWKCLESFPEPVQKVAKKNFKLLKMNPSHPSLHFKKVGEIWSVRAGINHRAIAVGDGDDFIWAWMGNHGDYERIIKSMR